MKATFFKTVLREIKGNFGRFIAIFAITALGVGFLAGLLSTAPDMYNSIDTYYDKTDFMDINIKSTGGITEEDIAAVKKESYVENVTASFVSDVVAKTGDKDENVARVYGTDIEALKNKDSELLNRPELKEGRFPDKINECVVESPNSYYAGVEIGDIITLKTEDDSVYNVTSFTVVGIVSSPMYMSIEKESSTVGNGRVSIIIFADKGIYKNDYYTDIFLMLKGAAKLNTFYNQYEALRDDYKESIKSVAGIRETARYDEIVSEANEKLEASISELAEKRAETENELNSAKEKLDKAKIKIDASQNEITAKENELKSAEKALNESSETINGAKSLLASGMPLSNEIMAQIAAYDEGLKQLNDGKAQLENGKNQLNSAKKDYETGILEYENAKTDAEAALSSAEEEITNAKVKISEIEKPKWYILDRESNVSFVSFTSNAAKVDSIAKVFPIFFFLVAALVALTTMTRMVDEQRTEIGTLKALGYSNGTIALKYLIYSGFASLTGGAAGLAAGLYVLPKVIINAYNMMYRLPPIIISFNPKISFTALILAVICIEGASLTAVFENLKENPSRLMLPKSPKNGKRIFLESIPFLWKHMKFTLKVTARNLLRYKKRFFMTVIGISGCTALLLTGFGLRDAIGDIVDKQYGELQNYNLSVTIDKSGDLDEVYKYFDENAKGYMPVYNETGYVVGDTENELYIYVPSDTEKFEGFMNIRERKNGKKISLTENSIIITEKFASVHNIKIGSTVRLKNSDGELVDVTATGICENYIQSYIYMSSEKYSELFQKQCEFNELAVKFDVSDENTAMTEILKIPAVKSASFSSTVMESFKNMVDKINYIVMVLIVSAGLLAFVVLYNLTNINISERQKEIATIKVLGFFDNEVSAYIYRETFILSLIGTVAGLIGGIFLCRFVVTTAEVDAAMFGRTIYPMSFVFAAVITLFFTALVNLVMARKLKKVNMVESMKSVD